MRKLRIFAHVSLDGMISPRGDDDYANGGWTAPYRSPEGLNAVLALQGHRFDLLLGRRTYDLWTGYWPKAAKSPMSDSLNAAKKYVATHRPETLTWGPAEGLGANIVKGVQYIKSKGGPDLIVWGSSAITSVLFAQGLVDEVVLLVYPVVLGGGKRCFSDSMDPSALSLTSTQATSSGILINTYRHVGALQRDR